MRPRRASRQPNTHPSPLVLRQALAYTERLELPRFAWGERWLRGQEYALMLLRIEEYCEKYKIERYEHNQHPNQIYQRPQNGTIYFLRGSGLQGLAFPRTSDKKIYCWKKMNFPTLLPKSDPLVKYLVASSFISGSLHRDDLPLFRMHVVIPVKFQTEWLLCHIRKVSGSGEQEEGNVDFRECFADGKDLYRLFLYLHNNYHFDK